MAHLARDKKKLLNRVRRIQGQVNAIERLLEIEHDHHHEQDYECSAVLHMIAACRGALDSLMAEVIEGHVRFHVLDPNQKPHTKQAKAAHELIDVLKTYLK